MKTLPGIIFFVGILGIAGCKEDPIAEPDPSPFWFGADLSYVNQVMDHGGEFKVAGVVTNPYKIFKDNGTNLVCLRLGCYPMLKI
ncbi:MAG TPA: glycosyl hydrolase 53 family protein [Cyclobacteriaceae bacterium]|jgi:arabinogalactan endo-1,4-beta-galactosidase|nr:glycosyl hydrolase 53 family protein [Cytophagales bacterium]HMR56163.1 glycosyl hydrolase 53 family protein [Cyclobacteriaceae bacterium]HNT48951.1 glycosyl hydrolase 53 family protein [Cyclobacteriaceae bacterium]HRE65828.1 glycosyl hydrolase 53 family protein [Cyclobacteriaceae bacterium]HRF35623.1 glycosyl hydrolase 53 family protein [Cyclobacteriaceae bacterium]